MTNCAICDHDSGHLQRCEQCHDGVCPQCMADKMCAYCLQVNQGLAWLLKLGKLIPGLEAKNPTSDTFDLRISDWPWCTISFLELTPHQATAILRGPVPYISKEATPCRE